ncbi:MAG: hypothetical protein J5756_02360, partial [Clostridia bacterium]|nr:hypothetical protein [Clostridia bacterium]
PEAPAAPEAEGAPAAQPETGEAPASDAEPEDVDDGQLYFGGAAERFKDIDIKFGSDYDFTKE